VRDLITRLQELGRLDEAESAARALVARCPDDPGNHAMLAAVLLIAGQRDDGLRCLGAACAMDGGDGWAWERLLGLDPGAALVAARELLRRRPRDVLAHHRLAQALRLGGEPVRAREVYESARSLPGDRLVLLLGLVAVLRQLGDLDAAEAVCREPVHGVVPRELRLEAARIRHDRGDTATALTMLDALLAEQPEDHAARQCRCEWRSQSGRHEDAIADGEDLVRRLPGRGVPWAYLGDAQAQAGRDEAARASFRSASETDGLYAYGHGRWCDLALAAADLESAATALERLRRCDDGPWTRCRALRLAMARGRPEEARADLARLATEPSGADALLAACPGTPPAHWQQTLEDAWKDPGANRGVGVLLGRSWMEALRDRAVVDRLRSTPRRDAAWHAAVAAVIEIAAQRLNRDPVTALLRTDADDVRADPIAWGLAGWFLNRQRQHGAAVAWLADWRGRSGVEGWMVLNRISCLCQLGRMAEALADAADTAPLPGADDPMLRTWRAWGAALAGDRAAAEAALADRTALVEGNAGELVHVHDITRTLASVRHRTWAMLGKLRQHHPGCSWDTLRPYVRHTARVLAAEDGRWWRRIWGWYLGS
jgi:tetratricopeptide (TPR) repeat protein